MKQTPGKPRKSLVVLPAGLNIIEEITETSDTQPKPIENIKRKTNPSLQIRVTRSQTERSKLLDNLPKSQRKIELSNGPKSKLCRVCNSKVDNLWAHRKENEECCFKCDKCAYTAISTSGVTWHKINAHYKKKYMCHMCSKVLSDKSNFARHLKSHKLGPQFQCDSCGKMLSTKLSLEHHKKFCLKQTIRTGSRCFYCDMTFLRLTQRLNHIIDSHPVEYETDRKFLTKFSKSHEMQEGAYRDCSICQKTCKFPSTYYAHLKTHSIATFSCEKCDFKTSNMSHLVKHKRTHTGEKPFSCLDCKKTFRQDSHLRNHMLMHKNIRRFTCDICDKSFVQKGNFDLHMLRHKGVKPFPCHVCKKGFYTSSSRKLHVLKLHGETEVENIRNHVWKIDVKNTENNFT